MPSPRSRTLRIPISWSRRWRKQRVEAGDRREIGQDRQVLGRPQSPAASGRGRAGSSGRRRRAAASGRRGERRWPVVGRWRWRRAARSASRRTAAARSPPAGGLRKVTSSGRLPGFEHQQLDLEGPSSRDALGQPAIEQRAPAWRPSQRSSQPNGEQRRVEGQRRQTEGRRKRGERGGQRRPAPGSRRHAASVAASYAAASLGTGASCRIFAIDPVAVDALELRLRARGSGGARGRRGRGTSGRRE